MSLGDVVSSIATPSPRQIAPRQVHTLDEQALFFWSSDQHWRIFAITHRWQDGVLAHEALSDGRSPVFVPAQQWVPYLPPILHEAALAGQWGGQAFQVRVAGTSMEPTLPFGCWVDVVPCCPSLLVPGDVVVWGHPHYWNTHRIRKIDRVSGQLVIWTRGDALSHDDPPLEAHRILGRVVQAHTPDASWDPHAHVHIWRAQRRWWRSSARLFLKSL